MDNKYISTEVEWLEKVEQLWKNDVAFFTSTETTLQLLITWDQVWPRVSFPCFYRHPPQVKYTYTNSWKNQVLSLSLDNISFCSLTTETNTRGAPPTRAYNPYRVPNLYNQNISLALSNLNTRERQCKWKWLWWRVNNQKS